EPGFPHLEKGDGRRRRFLRQFEHVGIEPRGPLEVGHTEGDEADAWFHAVLVAYSLKLFAVEGRIFLAWQKTIHGAPAFVLQAINVRAVGHRFALPGPESVLAILPAEDFDAVGQR